MGKTDRIQELESRLAATESVLYSVSSLVGVDMTGQAVSMREVPVHIAKLSSAIAKLRTQPEVDADDALGYPSGTSLQTFDRFVDGEIDRIAANDAREDAAAVPTVRVVMADILRDLGLGSRAQESIAEMAIAIRDELRRLKNPSTDIASDGLDPNLTKGDSLAQAIEHNAGMRAHLEAELRSCRMIVQRIAATLQVPKFDIDGTELLEKVQRWENLKYTIRKRRNDRLKSTGLLSDALSGDAVAAELGFLLTFLVAPKTLSEWLATKPPMVASDAVLALAAEPAAPPQFGPMSVRDLMIITNYLQTSNPSSKTPIPCSDASKLCEMFEMLVTSRTAATEMVNLINLIVIPLLNRQAAAQAIPA